MLSSMHFVHDLNFYVVFNFHRKCLIAFIVQYVFESTRTLKDAQNTLTIPVKKSFEMVHVSRSTRRKKITDDFRSMVHEIH